MIEKQALEYVVGLRKPEVLKINGSQYVDKSVERIDFEQRASSIEMSNLTSLVDYIKSQTDSLKEKMIVQVVSPTEVRLISCLDMDRKRECLVDATADIPDFRFGSYINHESFLIALQSKFIDNDDRTLLLKFTGTVENGTVAKYGDDGVTQTARIKTGIASKENAIVPNPVKLIPFRTFMEVEQPESAFVFRMRQDERSGVECAIFEADGGAWRNEAMKCIKEFLCIALADLKQFTIIS